jgi:hypothetical protein
MPGWGFICSSLFFFVFFYTFTITISFADNYFKPSQMNTRILLPLILLALVISFSCRRQEGNINLEQQHRPGAHHFIAPGLGTLGMIQDQKVFTFFLNENLSWIMDKNTQFNIPEYSEGLISLGMGYMGVKTNGSLEIYRLDQENRWVHDPGYSFKLPRRYKRINAVMMPWEMGVLAFEINGYLEFYYFDDNQWRHDETASFRIPEGVDDYVSLGSMTIGVIFEDKLGICYLDPQGVWKFVDNEDFILLLPDDYQGIIPFEPGVIAMLRPNQISFYQIDDEELGWVTEPAMDFFFMDEQ